MLHQFDYLWLENLNFKKRGNFGIEVIIFYFKMPENHKNAKFESFLVGKNQKVPSYDVDDLVDRLNERSKRWIIIIEIIFQLVYFVVFKWRSILEKWQFISH